MTGPKFIKRKKPNYKRSLILIIVLIIALIVFYNIEAIMEAIF